MSEDLDRWLRPDVEPLPPRPGTFAAVRARARRRRRTRTVLAGAAVAACIAMGTSAGLALSQPPGPGPTDDPVAPVRSASPTPSQEPAPTTPAAPTTGPTTGATGGPTDGPTGGPTDGPTAEPPVQPSGTASSPSGEPSGGTSPDVDQTGTPPVTSSPGRCRTADLAVRIEPSDAAAGSRYAVLVLTNTSLTPCTLDGHPGMLLLDDEHEPLPTDVRRVAPEPRRVLLSPGGAASARLRWSPVPGDDRPCQPPARSTLVTPPDAYRSLTVPFRADPCHGVVFATSVVADKSGP